MPDHVVRQGECLSSIAHANGFAKPLDIWNDPHNAGLREKRHDPNVLHPGDVLWIPEKTPKTEHKPSGQSHAFKAKVIEKAIRLVIRDAQEKPVTGAEWTLVAGGESNGLEFVDATPKAPESQFSRIRLGFVDNLPRRMELTDAFGQTTELTFADVKRNPKLAADVFRFAPPQGADVVGQ